MTPSEGSPQTPSPEAYSLQDLTEAMNRLYPTGAVRLRMFEPEVAEGLVADIAAERELHGDKLDTDLAARLQHRGAAFSTVNRLVDQLQQSLGAVGNEQAVGRNPGDRGLIIAPDGGGAVNWHTDTVSGFTANMNLINEADFFFYSPRDKRIHGIAIKPGDVVFIRNGVWHSVTNSKNPGERILVYAHGPILDLDPTIGARGRAAEAISRKQYAQSLEAKKNRFGGKRIIWEP